MAITNERGHTKCKKKITSADKCFGNPSFIDPTCVVVPPMSITMPFCTPDKKAAPCMLFVRPDVNVSTGKRRASSKLKETKQKVESGYVTITTWPIKCVFFVKKYCS